MSSDRNRESSNRRTVDLSLIVVTYNSGNDLPAFIESLKQHPPTGPWELIVFDNASGDDSIDRIRTAFTEAHILESDSNRGFAAAVNAAARIASGRYYLVINPDVSWTSGAIDQLIAVLDDHQRAAAVTPRLVFPDGRPQASVRRFPTHGNIWFSRGAPWSRWWGKMDKTGRYTQPDPDTAQPIEAAAAACLLIRAEAFACVDGLDEGYFLYVEDTDFCRRLSDAGWEIWMEPAIQVVHRWGSMRTNDPIRRRHHRRGIRRYFRKFHPTKRVRNGILFTALTLADALSRMLHPGAWRGGTR